MGGRVRAGYRVDRFPLDRRLLTKPCPPAPLGMIPGFFLSFLVPWPQRLSNAVSKHLFLGLLNSVFLGWSLIFLFLLCLPVSLTLFICFIERLAWNYTAGLGWSRSGGGHSSLASPMLGWQLRVMAPASLLFRLQGSIILVSYSLFPQKGPLLWRWPQVRHRRWGRSQVRQNGEMSTEVATIQALSCGWVYTILRPF